MGREKRNALICAYDPGTAKGKAAVGWGGDAARIRFVDRVSMKRRNFKSSTILVRGKLYELPQNEK